MTLALKPHRNTITVKGKDIPLYGKLKVVSMFGDFKVQVVDCFPDLRVQRVTAFQNQCGKWQFVESFPDFTIELVTAFPDLKIQYINSFPGVTKRRNANTTKQGQNAMVYEYTPSIELKAIEDLFFSLQNEHRNTQASLNAIKYKVQQKVDELNHKANNRFSADTAEYNNSCKKLQIDFHAYKEKKSIELSKIKIIIPNALDTIFDILNKIGKQNLARIVVLIYFLCRQEM